MCQICWLAYIMQMCDMVTSHRIKGETADYKFQEQCFLWEPLLVWTVAFITFKIFYILKDI